MEAKKMKLPKTSPLSPPHINSILINPSSLSLSLNHSDSSITLLSLSTNISHSIQTRIPNPVSSSSFFTLQNFTHFPNPSFHISHNFNISSSLFGLQNPSFPNLKIDENLKNLKIVEKPGSVTVLKNPNLQNSQDLKIAQNVLNVQTLQNPSFQNSENLNNSSSLFGLQNPSFQNLKIVENPSSVTVLKNPNLQNFQNLKIAQNVLNVENTENLKNVAKSENPNSSTVFVTTSPLQVSNTSVILIRFWVLGKNSQFTKTRVICKQKGFEFDEKNFGVVFNVAHGGSIRVFGTINVFVMYSVLNKKIWVFSVKKEGEKGLKLMKCGVIECVKTVYSISLEFGFLILGEENGVRVFRLRPLVKGKKDGNKLPKDLSKLRPVKLNQDSKESGAFFVEFQHNGSETEKQTKEQLQLAKTSSIQALSPDKFLVLDSTGDLHLLCLSNTALASEIPFTMKQLPNFMKVQKLAVFPAISTKTRHVWISDGYHTVYAIAFPGVDVSVSESGTKQSEDQLIQGTVSQAIFTSEKIQGMVPLATNAVLILGQGSLFVYSIS